MVYLGSTLHASGSSVTEVGRRIGFAAAALELLSGVWEHAAITSIFDAVVVTRLKYALPSAWLMKSDLRKLGGFYCGGTCDTLCAFHMRTSTPSATKPSFNEQVAQNHPRLYATLSLICSERF